MDNNTNNSYGNSGTATMSNTDTTTMVTAIFNDRDAAERAYTVLEERGYSKDDVNVLMSDDTRKRYFTSDDDNDTGLGNKTMEGAGKGSAIGGTLGAIIGAIAAIGTSIAIPGLGLVIAGPIAAALAGAGAGGLTGGLIGALAGAGVPKDRAENYERSIKEGGILLGVHPRSTDDAEFIEKQWRSIGGQDIHRM